MTALGQHKLHIARHGSSGAMEQWSNGAMEQWSNGAMEQRSNGAVDSQSSGAGLTLTCC